MLGDNVLVLGVPFKNHGNVLYDSLVGRVVDGGPSSGRVRGVCHFYFGGMVALYCHEGRLIFQVDEKKLDFATSDVSYYHQRDKGETVFSIRQGALSYSLTYSSWWGGLMEGAPLNPEWDADEDFFGYVFYVRSTPSLQKSLINAWC